jgi:CHAT domain
MTDGLSRLAGRITGALLRLLPTADWTGELAGDVARILSGSGSPQVAAISSELRASRNLLRRADSAHKDEAEGELYEQWSRRLELILAAVPDPVERAGAVLAILQAAGGGFRSGWYESRGGTFRGAQSGSTRSATDKGAGTGPADPGDSGRRYLRGRCPGVVTVGKAFSLVADIVRSGTSTAARLLPFDVPADGADVLLVLHAPGLAPLGEQRLTAHVPAAGDSAPVMFELRPDAEGPRSVSITAWRKGTYLGELLISVTAVRDRAGRDLEFRSEIAAESAEGAVSLVVRHDPALNAYRFEFRDEDYPNEVTTRLSFDPRHRIEELVAGLDRLAARTSGYSREQARDYLVQAGAGLWHELIPPELREQFWDRQGRIRQLTILSDKDTVPWELLYPRDLGHDKGFLVEQFPVTRAVFGKRPASRLGLWPARFVLPAGSLPGADSLPGAEAEVDALRRLLDPSQPDRALVTDLTSLLELVRGGDFGLLHFACHNRFDPDDEAAINLGGAQFTPTFLTTAAIDKVLAPSAPTVFINACRSAGLAPKYHRLSGWASMFLDAGAGAFIGSLWAVSDGAAREFAEELYTELKCRATFGEALKAARTKAAAQAHDPTWLAYSAYGDPQAKISPP